MSSELDLNILQDMRHKLKTLEDMKALTWRTFRVSPMHEFGDLPHERAEHAKRFVAFNDVHVKRGRTVALCYKLQSQENAVVLSVVTREDS
jgi:hypothetical protein